MGGQLSTPPLLRVPVSYLFFYIYYMIRKKLLKVLSSEMDPAEIRVFRKVFIKREARRFSEKSARTPSCECPLKIPRSHVQLLAIRKNLCESLFNDDLSNEPTVIPAGSI
jgi:hypothetical protein